MPNDEQWDELKQLRSVLRVNTLLEDLLEAVGKDVATLLLAKELALVSIEVDDTFAEIGEQLEQHETVFELFVR
eukprot:CAMPEP_0185575766 /NCGR_PEP_ID=MMETSP0434-20130131/6860_1 /TAXON_ID=626734 ORGANISM="Favella taraikaensis, Strain Fe Narragansett Bay" /NCGR_SAMPLE_ID=MMETSP0434 /ASSEMBLY_ACC=CAM_ASM_000379 /LENGTH=73 /DNA_ID=CAMNT_0028192729 /DNA_START=1871 /DNA_END=2092 /DNA_ORIENTATION=-